MGTHQMSQFLTLSAKIRRHRTKNRCPRVAKAGPNGMLQVAQSLSSFRLSMACEWIVTQLYRLIGWYILVGVVRAKVG